VTQSQLDSTLQIIQTLIGLFVASGLAGVAYKWLQAKGIDTKAVLNNNLVGAAERAAPGLLKDVLVMKKPLTDPAVLAELAASLTTSLNATHDVTIAQLGATKADVVRIAQNAVDAEAKATLDVGAQAPATPAPSTASAVLDAVATISATQAALSTLNTLPVVPAIAPQAVQATSATAAPAASSLLDATGAPVQPAAAAA
jgi:hypothetical protein